MKIYLQLLKKKLQSKFFLLFLFLLIILISYYRVNLDVVSFYKGSELEFKLEVSDKKYKNNQYTISFLGKEKIISYVKDFSYDVGDIVYVKGSLNKIKKNTIPNVFNYQRYLQSRGILWELKINEIKLVKKNNSIFNTIKKSLTMLIENSNSKYKEYLAVFVFGDSSYFTNNQREIYEKCGLNYLISIGSLQVMAIVFMLKKIEGRLRIKKRNSLIINAVIIFLYILFTNRIIGVLRSGLCYIITSFLKYYKIKYKYQNILLIVGCILLLINPFYIINSGFLYSFTISIIINFVIKIIKGSYFKKLLIISFIAFLASLPITIYFNYEINFMSIIYSVIFVPIFHFIVFPLSIIVFLLPFLTPIYNFVISFIEYIIDYLSNINILTFIFRKPSMLVIIIYYWIIISVLINKKNIWLLLIIILVHININRVIPETIVSYLDVAEGDAILIKNNNHLFLLDTGGNIYSNYSRNIIQYIKSLGMNKIKTLILSHGDYDHMGEAITLVNNFKVEKVIFNCGAFNDLEKELIKVLDKKKIKYYSCIKELNIDKNKLHFLQTREYDNENDNSNVIIAELDGYKFMFMGDASSVTEKEILSKYNLPDIDVLKVGHHGSKTSSSKDFINEINPKYSIISVGKNNRYGHPNKEVLDNLEKSKIYRTDEDGSVMFKIKNNKLKIDTCSP